MKLFLQVLFLLSATLTAFAQDNHSDDNSVPRFDTLSIWVSIERQMADYPESTLHDIFMAAKVQKKPQPESYGLMCHL